MTKIKFNEVELGLESYNKNTTFSNGIMNSVASCTVTDNIDGLMDVAAEEITSVVITNDDAVIYSLTDTHAHIDNINEYLTDNRVIINVNMTFTEGAPEVEPEVEPEEENI